MSQLINEGFEGTGAPSGWSMASGADPDYTTGALAGSQSLRTVSTAGFVPGTVNLGADYNELWMKHLVKAVSCATSSSLLQCLDSSFNVNSVQAVLIPGSGGLTVDFVTYNTFNVGTTYFMWWHFLRNGTSELWWNTVDDRSTATHVTQTASNFPVQYIQFGCTNVTEILWDSIQIADTDIFAGAATVTVNLTGVGATPAVGTVGFNVSLPLGSVSASPAIGTGTVTTDTPATVTVTLTGVAATPSVGIGTVVIEGEVITPPVEDLVPGRMWYGLPEDAKVYLTGVSANPRVGKIAPMARGTLEQLEKLYPFPKRVEERPLPVARRKAKPPKPTAFVYMAGVHPVPKIGSVTMKMFYEDSDEEVSSILRMLDVDEEVINALKLAK